jgi:hypothetical protein
MHERFVQLGEPWNLVTLLSNPFVVCDWIRTTSNKYRLEKIFVSVIESVKTLKVQPSFLIVRNMMEIVQAVVAHHGESVFPQCGWVVWHPF